MSAVVFDNVDIVFGDKQAEALSMVDRGATRDEILKSTGVVLAQPASIFRSSRAKSAS
jgi:glycine betaine/proline transport system ATP-binding protein